MIQYVSTRGNNEKLNAAQAIIKGLADDKGLFVPTEIPDLKGLGLDVDEIHKHDYKDIAGKILGGFFQGYSKEEIEACVKGAYSVSKGDENKGNFSREEIVPLVKAGKAWFLELYHGRTSAFKDMALSILPYLLTTAVKKIGEEKKICILTATSGDTGKAALAGFADIPGTEIIVFYPEEGVSEVQKAQMVTLEVVNTNVFAIRGNFDDAQRGVKKILNDSGFNESLAEKGVKLSSANSINIGRLIPQVAYYVYGYGQLVKEGVIKPGEKINIVVPTGNFGNILAAYYGMLMGLPVNRFICASNENKVLTDFMNTGVYDARREFYLTNSPSMDILISSNLERLLYHLSGGDSQEVQNLMKDLDSKGHYSVNSTIREGLSKFYGGYADMKDTNEAIGKMYGDNKYLMDTHTAVAYKVYEEYVEKAGDETPSLIASTASPFKFARSVSESIGISGMMNDFRFVEELSKASGVAIPEGLRDLDKREIIHKDVISIDEMPNAVMDALK